MKLSVHSSAFQSALSANRGALSLECHGRLALLSLNQDIERRYAVECKLRHGFPAVEEPDADDEEQEEQAPNDKEELVTLDAAVQVMRPAVEALGDQT